ncbi:MAG: hypothetical protein ACI9D5_002034 [Candidatus Endobugula sp.]|jgi:hypothetical protein
MTQTVEQPTLIFSGFLPVGVLCVYVFMCLCVFLCVFDMSYRAGVPAILTPTLAAKIVERSGAIFVR